LDATGLSELLCAVVSWAVMAGLALGVPTARYRGLIARERELWPPSVRSETVRVSVGEGAFRDATAEYERHESLAGGAPRAVKLAAFLSLVTGQLWPLAGVASIGAALTAVALLTEGSLVVALLALAACVGSASLALSTFEFWNAAQSLLRREPRCELRFARASRWALASCAGFGALFLGLAARQQLPFFVLLLAPAFALYAQTMFTRHVVHSHRARFDAPSYAAAQHGSVVGTGSVRVTTEAHAVEPPEESQAEPTIEDPSARRSGER
jgi:hypothetical protein